MLPEEAYELPVTVLCYVLCYGRDPDCVTWTQDVDDLPELIEHYIAVQQFSILIQEDGNVLGVGRYECLDCNTHELRVIIEAGQAVGLAEKLVSLLKALAHNKSTAPAFPILKGEYHGG